MIDVKLKKQLSRIYYDLQRALRNQGKPSTQADIARLLGYSQSAISQFVSDRSKTSPPFKFQYKLCLIAGVDLVELHPDFKTLEQIAQEVRHAA